MATQCAKDNILETIKDHKVGTLLMFEDESILEDLANAIAKNLCIEYQQFPKWE
jgi:hypothetical protein